MAKKEMKQMRDGSGSGQKKQMKKGSGSNSGSGQKKNYSMDNLDKLSCKGNWCNK